MLVPSARPPDERPVERARPRVRRYSLARVSVSPSSALGVDWHARLEEVADRERS